MLRVSHVFLSPFRVESRVIKEMRSLQKKFPEAFISFVGLKEDNLPSYEIFENGVKIYREHIATRSLSKSLFFQSIKYIEWTARVLFRLRAIKPTHLHCHSLGALPAAVLSKIFSKSCLIYDAHELETRRHGMSGLRQKGAYVLEKSLMRFVDNIIVVSPSIQEVYQSLYPKKKIRLLVNAPSKSESTSYSQLNLRQKFKISEDEFLFICIGSLGKGRGVELCLDVFKKLERPYHILFIGKGIFEKAIQDEASHHNNIHYLPPVPHDEVISIVKDADVLLRLLETAHLSYLYALPNAVFQAQVAGIPYVVNRDCIDIVRFFSSSSLCIPVENDKDVLYNWCLSYRRENFPKKNSMDESYTWEAYEHVLFEAYQDE